MSMRALIGIVQALLTPGSWSAAFISEIRLSMVTPGLHSPGGFRLTMVSLISTGAGSVAVTARPALPKTEETSGNDLMMQIVADDPVLDSPQLRQRGAAH